MESRTHRAMLVATTFLTSQHVLMYIRNHHVGTKCKFSLKGVWLAIAESNRPNVR